jgi:hypothetical protein
VGIVRGEGTEASESEERWITSGSYLACGSNRDGKWVTSTDGEFV